MRFIAALDAERLVPLASGGPAHAKPGPRPAPADGQVKFSAKSPPPSSGHDASRRPVATPASAAEPGPQAVNATPQGGPGFAAPSQAAFQPLHDQATHSGAFHGTDVRVLQQDGLRRYAVTTSSAALAAQHAAVMAVAANMLPLMSPSFTAQATAVAAAQQRTLQRAGRPPHLLPSTPGSTLTHPTPSSGIGSARLSRATPCVVGAQDGKQFVVAGVSPSRSAVTSPLTVPVPLETVSVTAEGSSGMKPSSSHKEDDPHAAPTSTTTPHKLQYTLLSPPSKPGAKSGRPAPLRVGVVQEDRGRGRGPTMLESAAAAWGHGPASPSVQAAGGILALATAVDGFAPASPHLAQPQHTRNPNPSALVLPGLPTPGEPTSKRFRGEDDSDVATPANVNPKVVLSARSASPPPLSAAQLHVPRRGRGTLASRRKGWGSFRVSPRTVQPQPLVVHPRNTLLAQGAKRSGSGVRTRGSSAKGGSGASPACSVPHGGEDAVGSALPLTTVPVGTAARGQWRGGVWKPVRGPALPGISVALPSSRGLANLQPSPSSALPQEVLGTGADDAPPSSLHPRQTRTRQLSRAGSEMSQNTVDFEAAGVLTGIYQES